MKYDLSVILPGLNPETWLGHMEDIRKSMGSYTFELIGVGPRPPTQEFLDLENTIYIQEFGHPSRCVQRATTVARGKYVTSGMEDGKWQPRAYEECLNILENELSYSDGICVRFYEQDMDPNAPLPPQPPEWPNVMSAWYHRDLRLPGISNTWYWHGCWMYNLEFFKEIGGLDCRFEHINLNCSDLAFRVQANGGKVIPSPNFVINVENKSAAAPSQRPIETAFHENDKPLLDQIYSDPQAAKKRFKINYDNWMDAEEVWSRRFGKISLAEAREKFSMEKK